MDTISGFHISSMLTRSVRTRSGGHPALRLFFVSLMGLGILFGILFVVASPQLIKPAAAQTPSSTWNTQAIPHTTSGSDSCSLYSGYVYCVFDYDASMYAAYGAVGSNGEVASWQGVAQVTSTSEAGVNYCGTYGGYINCLTADGYGHPVECWYSAITSSGFTSWSEQTCTAGNFAYLTYQPEGSCVQNGEYFICMPGYSGSAPGVSMTITSSGFGSPTVTPVVPESGAFNSATCTTQTFSSQLYVECIGDTGLWYDTLSGGTLGATWTAGTAYPVVTTFPYCGPFTGEIICASGDSTHEAVYYQTSIGGTWTSTTSLTYADEGASGSPDWWSSSAYIGFVGESYTWSNAISTVTVPIDCSLGASEGTHSNSAFAFTGGSPSPGSGIECATGGYTTDITMNPSTYWSFSAPAANGTTRIEYYNSSSSSATTDYEGESCSSGTCSTVSMTFYYQISETASYSLSGGGSPTAPTLTYVGFGAGQDYAMTGTGTTTWLDFGSTWSSTNPLTGSNSSTRFEANTGYSGSATAGGTIDPPYYHQEACACSYSGIVAAAPSIDGTAFGSSGASTTLTTGGTTVWLDAGRAYTITKPSANFPSATERYETDTANGTVSGHFTLAPAFYKQWYVTYAESVSGGGSPALTDATGYTQFGSVEYLTPTTGGALAWTDNGTIVDYSNPIAGGSGERWDAPTYSFEITSAGTVSATYYHQYEQPVSYSWTCITGHTCSETPTFTYTADGSSGQTLGETTSPQDVWVDAGTTATVTTTLTDVQGDSYSTSPTSWSISATDQTGNPSSYGAELVTVHILAFPAYAPDFVVFTVTGCSTNSTVLPGDGAEYSFSVTPGCSSMTVTAPAATTTERAYFSVGLNSSENLSSTSEGRNYIFPYRVQFYLTNEGGFTSTGYSNGTSIDLAASSGWVDAGTNVTVDIPQFLPSFFVSSQEFVYFEPYFGTNFVVVSNDSLSAFSYAGQGIIQFTGGSTYGKVWNSASYPVQQVSFAPSGSATKTGTTSWNGNLMTGWFTAQPAGAGAFYQLSFNIPVLGGGRCVENCSPPPSNTTTSSTSSPSGTGGSPGGSGSGGNGVGPGGTPTGNPVLPQPDTEIFIGSLLILLLLLLAFAYKKARKEVDRAERRFEGKFKQPKRDGRKGM